MADRDLSGQEARRRLYDVMNSDEPFELKAVRAMELGEAYLGVDNVHLAKIDPEHDYWKAVLSTDGPDGDYPAGMVSDLGESYCQYTIEQGGSLALHDVGASEVIGDAELDRHGLHCYHGTALSVAGELYGTLCFVAADARAEPFSEEETMFAELVTRTLEHELRRERTEADLERLDEFASMLSHDLRNPLTIANARLELAAQESDSDHLDGVAEALDRIDALVTDALTVAREGEAVTEFQPVDVGETARTCWRNVATDEATLEVTAENVVRGDSRRLKRLLENLIRNGVQHGAASQRAKTAGGAGGEGENARVTITVGDLPDGFYVADDGPGIPEADREQVFDAGFSTDERGTGLGLNIVQQVALAHDWRVSVTESESGGARFEIRDVDLDDH